MNSPVMPDIPREELWLIVCNLAIKVDEVRTENSELRMKFAQVNEIIQSLQVQLALPRKTAQNSSVPPAVSHKKRCEKGLDVPFTNNASERALGPAVIHHKVIGGFRSEAGATVYALYRTVEDTARKRGQNLLKTLYQALTGVNVLALACFS
jgi:hypothetical protein